MNKPTPEQIANSITEHQYGMPDLSAEPGDMPDVYNLPEVEGSEGSESNGQCTEMRSCSAVHCIHNKDGGLCNLDAIEINEYGGCSQYEATATARNDDEDTKRYEEKQTDITGGDAKQLQPPDNERHWETGRYDPQGSSV